VLLYFTSSLFFLDEDDNTGNIVCIFFYLSIDLAEFLLEFLLFLEKEVLSLGSLTTIVWDFLSLWVLWYVFYYYSFPTVNIFDDLFYYNPSNFFFSLSKMLVDISNIYSLEKYWSSILISDGLYAKHAILKAWFMILEVLWSQFTQLGSSWIVGLILF
jgi:hypothetical protein